MSREPGTEPDCYLYVDEFQTYINAAAFETTLSRGRKYLLNLTMAHQYVDQIRPIAKAVFGNVGTKVILKVGKDDAPPLAKELGLEPYDLMAIDRYHGWLKYGPAPFTLATLPPFNAELDLASEDARARRQQLIDLSREKYCTFRSEIPEEWQDTAVSERRRRPKREHKPQPPAKTEGFDQSFEEL